jgi:hypothetical protein
MGGGHSPTVDHHFDERLAQQLSLSFSSTQVSTRGISVGMALIRSMNSLFVQLPEGQFTALVDDGGSAGPCLCGVHDDPGEQPELEH